MLIQCPECRQRISDQAEVCPRCGRPISDEERGKARAEATATQKAQKGCCVGCLVAVAAIMIILVGIGGREASRHGSSTPRPEPASPTPIDAWVMAQHFVKDRLRAPSTASFGSLFGDYQDPATHVADLGDGRYRVSGWVDAENAFGARVRSDFVCVLQYMGDERWRCEEITITGR